MIIPIIILYSSQFEINASTRMLIFLLGTQNKNIGNLLTNQACRQLVVFTVSFGRSVSLSVMSMYTVNISCVL